MPDVVRRTDWAEWRDTRSPEHGIASRSQWGDRVMCRCGVTGVWDPAAKAWVGIDGEHYWEHEPPEIDQASAEVDRLMALPPAPPTRVRYVLCTDVPGCTEWQGHAGPHRGRGIVVSDPDYDDPSPNRVNGSQQRAFRAALGVDPDRDRETFPSRRDRSAEYAKRNRARRHGEGR